MELSKLCEKIIDDAKVQAAGIIEDANRKSVELINSASEKNRKKAEKIKESAPASAKEKYDRIVSDASLAAKKEILAGKRKLVNLAFEKALEKLENLSSDEYKALLSEKGKDIPDNAEVEIAGKYSEDITDEFLKSVNPLLSKSEKTVSGGFNFVMKNSRLNYNFSEIAGRVMEEKDTDVASILFS